MNEPTAAALGGEAPFQVIRRYFLATRPKFFTASVLPMLIGSAWGWNQAVTFDAIAFILGLAATVFVHGAANVLNDVFDGLNGNDTANQGRIFPYTGGSRFIQNGILTTRQMTGWGVLLLALGVVSGVALALYKGPMILAFGAIGVALGVLYSAPPLHLSARGLGEIAVGIAFGALPVVGAAWLQTGLIDINALILSIPASMWVIAILLINEVPDAAADASVGRRTLVVRYGPAGARLIYVGLSLIAFAGFILAWNAALIPAWGLIFPALLVIGGIKAGLAIAPDTADNTDSLKGGIEMTLGMHMTGCLWMLALVTGTGLWW